MILDQKFKDFLIDDKSKVSLAVMITNSDELDHIKVTEDGSISFRAKEKETETPWDAKGRTKVKPGKFASRILGDVVKSGLISNRDIELWVNKFKSHFEGDSDIEVVTGDKINWCYNSKNYTSDRGGTLWSCMSGNECDGRFNLYTENPESVGLVVQFDSKGKVKTRALLWTLKDGKKLMDRIYYANDHSHHTFLSLCKSRGWLQKDNLNYKFNVPIKNWQHKNYPYLDTMRFIERVKDNFFMTNFIEADKRNDGYVIPNGTAGYTINNHIDINGKWVARDKAANCAVTRKGYLLEDLVQVERHGKIGKDLVDTDKWGNKYYKEDLVESKAMGGKIPMRGAYQLADNSDWIGRKRYRKLVEKGKLKDGSASYKGKIAWVLEENIKGQKIKDDAVKTDLINNIRQLNGRANIEQLGEQGAARLLETLNYLRTTNKLDNFKTIEDFSNREVKDSKDKEVK